MIPHIKKNPLTNGSKSDLKKSLYQEIEEQFGRNNIMINTENKTEKFNVFARIPLLDQTIKKQPPDMENSYFNQAKLEKNRNVRIKIRDYHDSKMVVKRKNINFTDKRKMLNGSKT